MEPPPKPGRRSLTGRLAGRLEDALSRAGVRRRPARPAAKPGPPGSVGPPRLGTSKQAARPEAASRLRQVERLSRVRQGLAIAVLVTAAAVLLAYVLNHRQMNRAQAREENRIPTLGLTVQQSASGVTIAKESGGRPVFRLMASRAITMKPGGEHVLRQVKFLAFNQDGIHADEVSGEEFAYDQASGDVRARGPVQIALQARVNPAGTGTDARESPIEIQARDLSFNLKTGEGTIQQGIEFRYLNAQGQAGQAQVDSRQGRLALSGGVRVNWQRPGESDLVVSADTGAVQRLGSGESAAAAPASAAGASTDAAVITLRGHAGVRTADQSLAADQLRFWMRPDRSLRRLDAEGHLQVKGNAEGRGRGPAAERAVRAEAHAGHADFVAVGPHHAALDHLVLDGGASLEQTSAGRQEQLSARSLNFLFDSGHRIRRLQALGQARLQLLSLAGAGQPRAGRAGPQNQSIAAPELDFDFAPNAAGATAGSARLRSLEASGGTVAELASAEGPVQAESDRFQLTFSSRQQPQTATADGNVRLRQGMAGSVRRSLSDHLELHFASTVSGGSQPALEQAVETGHVELQQGTRSLQADRAVYLPQEHVATFVARPGSNFSHGQVQVSDQGSRFRAPAVRWEQQADGSSLIRASGGVAVSRSPSAASADEGGAGAQPAPVVITAQELEWVQPPATGAARSRSGPAGPELARPAGRATFTGQVRLLQNPNLLRSDRMVLDAAQGLLIANGHVQADFVTAGNHGQGSAATPGSAVPILGLRTNGGPMPIHIGAEQLRYRASERIAVFQQQVELHAAQAVLQAPRLTLTFAPAAGAGTGSGKPSEFGPDFAVGGPQRARATGGVKIRDGGRQARAAEAEFDFQRRLAVLSGGSPSILDAEQGRITGDPLTFSLASDEIQVGSRSGERASGQTAVHK